MALLARVDRWGFLVALFAMGMGALVADAQEPQASEPQVKAAFLINFPKYAEWPAGAFATTNAPIVIAVLGESKVAEAIQPLILSRVVNGRGLTLKRIMTGEDLAGCHILFVSATEHSRFNGLPAKLKAGLLTVGESDAFLDAGGVINLARREQRIALEVNLWAAEKAGIKISSKLLSIAKVKGKAK